MQPAAEPPAGLPEDLLERLIEADERVPDGGGKPADHDLSDVVAEIHRREILQRMNRLFRLPGYVAGSKVSTALSLVITSSWPYFLNLILWPLPWDIAYRHLPGNLFALGAMVVCMTMLSVVWLSYGTALKVGNVMSDLVVSAEERARLRAWLFSGSSLWKQMTVAVPAAAIGVVLALIALGDEGGSWGSRMLLFLMGGWLGFLAGDILYWLLAAALIPGRLRRCGRLRMVWIDPASTPAIRNLCRFYAFVASGLAVTVLVFEVLAAVYARWQQSEVAANVVIALPVLSVVVALYVGVWPFMVIARLVRDHLDHLLDPVRAQMRRPPAALLTAPGFDDVVKVYQYFTTLRTLPFRTSALLQYVAGIAASLVVFFVQRYLTASSGT
ncbi:hypothetical protein FXF51_31295 [Nonomuraea sp. PA05]|uniref:hypothetical protein n=1 Tax=Nonomuraea sp. PA05 TaxID=2604466 RepID=UPI0011D5D1C5|nr:hypothetical protein [Nonomuraea sp. PA05]TYB60691.1 hypothetical protein FXF51_31295 [Nonomuraea sp. PA05]